MIIKTVRPSDIRPSEITRKDHYLNRRRFIQEGMLAGGALLAAPAFGASIPQSRGAKLENVATSPFSTSGTPTQGMTMDECRARKRVYCAAARPDASLAGLAPARV